MTPDPSCFPASPGAARISPVTAKPYPPHWEQVAEIRVLRAPVSDWDKLSVWGVDMRKRGWRLLQVNTDSGQIVAVFGKARKGPAREVP